MGIVIIKNYLTWGYAAKLIETDKFHSYKKIRYKKIPLYHQYGTSHNGRDVCKKIFGRKAHYKRAVVLTFTHPVQSSLYSRPLIYFAKIKTLVLLLSSIS